ncbi:hypothetical protein MalM25_04520 [Planctomycetes bacterium MalM25]|nr:hypothetical protein MalM25_04520 [Planctomycetes bacterium MalM25]
MPSDVNCLQSSIRVWSGRGAPRTPVRGSGGTVKASRIERLSPQGIPTSPFPIPALTLPSPAERPDADVVLYDGRCNFCCARVEQVRWLEGPLLWKSGERLAYLSLHDPAVAADYPDAPHERLLEAMCVVEKKTGRHHWGAEAVRYLSRRLPRLWWLAPVMHLPGIMLVARPVYAWVSRNRYLIGGKVEECEDGACSVSRR